MSELIEERPYTRDELRESPKFPPLRGLYCAHCRTRIPQFAGVDENDLSRVRELIRQGRMIMAIKELRAATDCPLAFANLWVAHRGWPGALQNEPPAPCPYCGEPLRTALARQCRHCKRDWHDPQNVRSL